MAVPQQLPHTHNPRRDVRMSKSKIPDNPNIVETYKIGASTVHIADNFIRTNPEDIKRVLDEFNAIGRRIVRKIYEAGGEI